MPAQTRTEKAQKEGRKLLALQALRKGQFSSAQAAARLYDVSKPSLTDRIHGRVARTELHANSHKLTETEEQALVQWILSMYKRGYPPRICAVGEAAKLILKQRVSSASALIGKNWPRNFVNRHTELKSKYTRKYDYQKVQCEDPDKLRDWFRLVENVVRKYGNVPDDTYNFNEVGYAMVLLEQHGLLQAQIGTVDL